MATQWVQLEDVREDHRNRPIYRAQEGCYALETRTQLVVSPDKTKAMISISHLLRGHNRYSGKAWTRWNTYSRDVMSITKAGYPHLKIMRNKMWMTANPYYSDLNPLFEALGISSDPKDHMPLLLEAWPRDIRRSVIGTAYSANLLPYQKINDPKEFILKAFKTYRKDLVKAVFAADSNSVAFALDFVGLVPIDWIIKFLKTRSSRHETDGSSPKLRKHIRAMTLQSRRNILASDRTITNWFARDIVRYPVVTSNENFQNLREYHAAQIDILRHRPRKKKKKIKAVNSGLRSTIDGTVFTWRGKDLTVVCAKDSYQLFEWSDAMHNCINSYENSLTDPNKLLGGIYDGNTLIANFEIAYPALTQLLGKYNESLDRSLQVAVEEVFTSLGIDCISYWGCTSPRAIAANHNFLHFEGIV